MALCHFMLFFGVFGCSEVLRYFGAISFLCREHIPFQGKKCIRWFKGKKCEKILYLKTEIIINYEYKKLIINIFKDDSIFLIIINKNYYYYLFFI